VCSRLILDSNHTYRYRTVISSFNEIGIEGLEADMSFFKDLFAGKKAKLKTPEERKTASIQRLKKEGIPYIEHLPVIESAEQVRPRSLEEIARRAITSLLIIQAALDIENNNYNDSLGYW